MTPRIFGCPSTHRSESSTSQPKNETASTAYSGTALPVSRRNSPQPGIPRSREKAYQVREALVSLENDRAFLTKGDVFSDDQIDAYTELKWEEVMRWETTPSPAEYDMYYSS